MTIDRADTRDVPGLRALFARLDELSALQADWDSYGGLPPTARSIGAASRLIVEVAAHTGTPPVDALPLPDGGLQLIWGQSPEELQIDVGPDGGFGYLVIDRSAAPPGMTEGDAISLAEAVTLVAQLQR